MTTPHPSRSRLRGVLGVALMIACFVGALAMRNRNATQRATNGQAAPVLVSEADVKPLSESLLMRIARPGEAAATLERADLKAPWTIRDATFDVNQARVTELISTLTRHCSGSFYPKRGEADEKLVRTAAEVLVGQHAFRVVEHERGERYSLERAGYPCQKPGEYIGEEEAGRVGLTTTQLRE